MWKILKNTNKKTKNMMNKTFKNYTKRERILLSSYLIWIMFHITIFLTGGAILNPDRNIAGEFWPFSTKYHVYDSFDPFRDYEDFCTYDITELIIYTTFPIFLYKIKCLLSMPDTPQK